MNVVRADLALALRQLLISQPLRSVAVLPELTMQRGVEDELRGSVREAKKHRLEAKDGLLLHVREYPANLLHLEASLLEVRVIDYEALGLRLAHSLNRQFRIQLLEH